MQNKFLDIAKTFNFDFNGNLVKTAAEEDILEKSKILQSKIAEALTDVEYIDEESFILEAIKEYD